MVKEAQIITAMAKMQGISARKIIIARRKKKK